MNRCFSCGKQINNNETMHDSCIKRFFKVNFMPKINFSLNELTIKAQEMAGKLSISGVQSKLSMKIDKKLKELIAVPEGGAYILKPQTKTYDQIPENENLCMTIAAHIGINVPAHTLMKLKDKTYAYVIKRFDRKNGNKINQEDFCQILEQEKKDKYKGSIEQIANKLNNISEIPGLDIQYLYEIVLFSFLIGNGDAHLKNYSINYTDMNNIRLSPAYDIVSSKIVIPGEEDFALTLSGKRNNLKLKDFILFSEKYNIPHKITDKILSKKQVFFDLINDSQLNAEYKDKLSEIVSERFSRLNSN